MTGTRSPFLEVGIMERFILDDDLPVDPSGDDATWATDEDRSVTFAAIPVRRSSAVVEVLGVNGLRFTGSWL